MPKTVWTILEDKLGKTTTSLAKKKARLIFTHPIKPATEQYSPTHFIQEKTGYTIFNHANVFSQHSLDIGTRFLLDHMPHFNDIKNIIDLGCGNGIVGLNLAMKYPKAEVTFIDESYMAIESARLTMKANDADLDQHRFLVNNCLDNFSKNTADLIVCNPPFHQSHTIGLHIALQMFRQSHQTLKKGGHLVVVANRHLPYYIPLKKLFSQVKNIANNRKFNLFGMKK